MTTEFDSPQTETSTEDTRVSSFGSSVYGGRPTFVMTRRESSTGGEVTLYELLPEERAATRRDRLERHGRSLFVQSFDEVFEDSEADATTDWDWENWAAVKSRVSTAGDFARSRRSSGRPSKDADSTPRA